MSDLQAIADRVEIEALRGEFADAVMMNDHDRLASLFTSDGAVRIPLGNIEAVGREQIRALGERRQALADYFVQTTHPGTIQLDGDTATGRAYLSELARTLDGQTWESWIRRNLRTKAGRAYFHVACEAVWAAEASDVSLLHALFYAHSNADLETLIAVDRGAQQDRVTGGSALVAETMAAALGERVVLGRPVRRIEHDGDGVRVVARDGSEYPGDAAVVTLPPTLAGRLEYDPPLPSWRDQLTQRMPAGSVIKTYAIYPEPFWRQDGLNGQAASDAGPVKVTFDNSPPSGMPGVLMGFLEGKEARTWARRSQAERREAVIGCFVRYFGPAAARPEQYVERDWMAEEFTRGCYGAHFAPGVWTSYGEAWRAPIGRIHWAGAECASQWNGYMEGAVRSGEATAEAVAAL